MQDIMKTIYKISVILITLFVISGCGKFSTDQIDKVDYSIMYENYSNHKLHIICYSDYYRESPKECKITKGYCDYIAIYYGIEGDTFEEREAVAQKLREILRRPELRGTFHVTCEGEATWAEFAAEIFRLAGRKQDIQPCTTEQFPRPAPRPKNSRLEKTALRLAGLPPMPHWKDALAEFMATEFPL